MKRILPVIFLLFCIHHAHSQGMWTWMGGPNTVGQAGVYGTQGVPSAGNIPPSTYSPFCWTDLQGNFWMYGCVDVGYGDADMWKYDPSIQQWTWVKGTGSANVFPVYGTQTVPNINNTPGSRGYTGCSWVSQNGDLWLYGGTNNGNWCNDLWRYNIASNEWTWMSGLSSGNQAPVYGTQGVPAPANFPGARLEIGSSWVSAIGKLWLYGGQGVAGYLSDMWMYDPANNEWTWVSGSQLTNVAGAYGASGVFSATNTPGARTPYSMWTDASGVFWLFGGRDAGTFYYSDLWKYDPSINQWAWINGSQTTGSAGVFGANCVADPTYYPGSRHENRSAWIDNANNLWLFGGGYGNDPYGDTWVYLHDCDEWARLGDAITPVYGTLGVPAVTNQPGQRGGSAHWKDTQGNLWLFGGHETSSSSQRSDLWKYTPDLSCITSNCNPPVLPVASFNSPDSVCTGSCITFQNTSTNATSFQWLFPGGTPASYSGQTPPQICYNTAGNYTAQLIATDTAGSDTATSVIHVLSNCPPPHAYFSASDSFICKTDCITFHDSSSYANNWFWTFPDGTPSTYNGQFPPLVCFDTLGGVLVKLVVSNSSGMDSVTIKILISDCTPHAQYFASDTSICHGDCITFNSFSYPLINTWQWTFPGGTPSSFNGQTPPSICYATPGYYTSQLIVINNYGTDTTTETIHVLPCIMPVAAFSALDTILCNGECTAFFNASTNSISWQWSFPGGTPSSFSGQNPTFICYNTPGIYPAQLIATNIYGHDTSTFNITVQDCSPVASFNIIGHVICVDSCIRFINTSINAVTSHWIFTGGTPSFYNGVTPPTVCYHTAGSFDITLIDSNGYGMDTITYSIIVHPNVVPGVSPSSTTIHPGESVQLVATGGNYYLWEPYNGISDSSLADPFANPAEYTVYYVTITDTNGCRATDSIVINVLPYIYLPDAFSPNNDGSNDYFHLLNAKDISSLNIKLFNRWGQLIFESNDPGFMWDGTFKNVPQEMDVYIYEMNYSTTHSNNVFKLKGNVTLIR